MMKLVTSCILAVVCVLLLAWQPNASALGTTPIGTEFTFQGRLTTGGEAIDGDVDLKFRLYDAVTDGALIGSELTASNVFVEGGTFTVDLDFGSGAFVGGKRWLEIDVRHTGDPTYETLTPRQPIVPVPIAQIALNGGSSPFMFTGDDATFTTGNVGIGTSTPGSLLTVDGTGLGAGSEATFIHPGSSTGTVQIGSPGGWPGFIVNAEDGGNYSMKFQDTGISLGAGASEVFWVGENDSIGIGTKTPADKLNVVGNVRADVLSTNAPLGSYVAMSTPGGWPGMIWAKGNGSGGVTRRWDQYINTDNAFFIVDNTAAAARLVINTSGNVGIGTTTPSGKLSVLNNTVDGTSNSIRLEAPNLGPWVSHAHHGPNGDWYIRSASGSGKVILQDSGGNVGIGTADPTEKLDVNGAIRIRGGADIVEGFETSCGTTLEPGTVVVIDPRNAGSLMQSTEAYDFKVAGVISGAGGVAPGIQLGQEGVLDGDTKVAMTGRVYVKCSTENGAIVPGDLLTTASLAGHAMKATDRSRSHGTVIGKAMSALDSDTGLVLVLVNLQ